MVVVVERGEVNRRSGLELLNEGTITCACNYSSGASNPPRTLCRHQSRPCLFPFLLVPLWLYVSAMVDRHFLYSRAVIGGATHNPPTDILRQTVTHFNALRHSESDVAAVSWGN